MKNIVLIFALSLFASGCNSILDSDSVSRKSGIIQPMGLSVWMYGTHTLENSNGKVVYALKSSSIDLNEYVGKRVRISGEKVDGYPVDFGPVYIDVKHISETK